MIALSEYLNEAAGRRAALGHFDCVRFVVDGLRIGWQRDFSAALEYSDRKTAVAQLRASGGLYDAVCGVLGQDVPASDLRPGDIAYFPDPALGLVLPGYVAVKTHRTILRIPPGVARSGWRTA